MAYVPRSRSRGYWPSKQRTRAPYAYVPYSYGSNYVHNHHNTVSNNVGHSEAGLHNWSHYNNHISPSHPQQHVTMNQVHSYEGQRYEDSYGRNSHIPTSYTFRHDPLAYHSKHKPKVAVVAHSYGTRMTSMFESFDDMKETLGIDGITVRWFIKGGQTWNRFKHDRSGHGLASLKQWSPDIVYFELGINDVDYDDRAETVCSRAKDLIFDLVKGGVKVVIIGQVIHRKKGSPRNPLTTINRRIDEYNTEMRTQFMNTSLPRKHPNRVKSPHYLFWDHRGLVSSVHKLYEKDGVHLRKDRGLRRLYYSTRNAVLMGLRMARSQQP